MPLRPELYRRLKDKFRHVVIANEGQEMLSRYEGGELVILRSGETYRVNCPHCNDTRKRLSINYRWGLVDDVTGYRLLWLIHCYNESCFKGFPERRSALYSELYDPTAECPAPIDEVVEGTWDDFSASRPAFYPGDVTPIDQLPRDHEAAVYLIQRGFDLKQLSDYFKIGYCADDVLPNVPMALGRIFIPVFKDSEFVGWQARTVGEPSSKFVPKYYSMPGWKKGMYVYNYDMAIRFNHVVICEGPSDVWRYGPEAVCLFGKCPTHSQAALLSSTWDIHILMLDSDVPENELESVTNRLDDPQKAVSAKRIVVRLPPGHDPGSMDPTYMRSLVRVTAEQEGLVLGTR